MVCKVISALYTYIYIYFLLIIDICCYSAFASSVPDKVGKPRNALAVKLVVKPQSVMSHDTQFLILFYNLY